MPNKLPFYNQIYENIMFSDYPQDEKDRQLALLMSELERRYNIPIVRDPEWEKNNKAVLSLYRKVSISRSL